MYFLKKFYSQFTVAFLTLAALGLLTLRLGHESDYGLAGRAVADLVSPLQHGATALGQSVAGVWYGYVDLVGVKQENDSLRNRVRRLQAEVVASREARLENERLHRLLALKESSGLPLLSAQVVAKSSNPWCRTVIVNRGTDEGISRGMAVVSPQGVVGRVISASRNYSKVLLANDCNSAIDATVQRSRAQGILVGSEGGMCRLKYVPRGDEVRPGDLIISSGLGCVFPKGFPLGVVERVARERAAVFQAVEIRPTVDFGSLEEVMVVKAVAGTGL
ncbi:MAG: rod shape-determining protein MreC [Pseudomonadota bacterium]